jgi:hypothetical protein
VSPLALLVPKPTRTNASADTRPEHKRLQPASGQIRIEKNRGCGVVARKRSRQDEDRYDEGPSKRRKDERTMRPYECTTCGKACESLGRQALLARRMWQGLLKIRLPQEAHFISGIASSRPQESRHCSPGQIASEQLARSLVPENY